MRTILSDIPQRFDTAVREGNVDALKDLIGCADDIKSIILNNDEKYGYLGMCLAQFPEDRHGGWQSSMSKERRNQRLSMAELLLDFGCSCNPQLVGVDQIERHVVTALLRFPSEFENESLEEKYRQIQLCRAFLDRGALCDFFQSFSTHQSLGFLLFSGEWLELLRDIPEFHCLGQHFTPEFVRHFLTETEHFLGKVTLNVPGGTVDVFGSGPAVANPLTVLALCNGHQVLDGTFHTLRWDQRGTVCSLLLDHNNDPSGLYEGKTVLEYWVAALTRPPVGFDESCTLEQLKVLAQRHPSCFAQPTDDGVLSDIVMGQALSPHKLVAEREQVFKDLFLFTYHTWQRECLQTAANGVHGELVRGGRKI